ncbi:hypothetical protein L3V31_21150 [Vibrio sp. J1-1]|uniref:hypothetical protein n=1 Tax=Vibrio sp. J1-1 TaxID=2912251 RepID=UPI001F2F9B24|nr:hypothetical protein [Vibrio sp. J1-1]MCF7484204.1 hypothetical protein [Vibrio sp. J1-1]
MSKKIGFFLRVFDNSRYKEDFLDGKIFMNRLSYFRHIEGDSEGNRADEHEGVNSWWQPNDVTLNLNGHCFSDLVAPIRMRLQHNDNYNVFCLFAATTDKVNLVDHIDFEEIANDFRVPSSVGNLGDQFVLVHNPREFINRIVEAVKSQDFVEGKAGLVTYYDPDTFSGDFRGIDAVFVKQNNFSHQSEYRFVIDTGHLGNEPLILNIGPIRDIATPVDSWDIQVAFDAGDIAV